MSEAEAVRQEEHPALLLEGDPIGSSKILDFSQRLLDKRDIAATLEANLEALKTQFEELHEEAVSEKDFAKLARRLDEISEAVEKAEKISHRLSADVILPPPEELRVRLVPSDSLERLEEYRSDKSAYSLFTGIFLGAALGILSNWVTNKDSDITRISIICVIFFCMNSVIVGFRSYQISRRAKTMRNRILYSSKHRSLEEKN